MTSSSKAVRSRLDLRGLRMMSPQTLGAIRMVPLVREKVREDLRLAMRKYNSVGVVSVDQHEPTEPGLKYIAFVPHGFVVSYTDDGHAVAALGASFGASSLEKKERFVRLLHRMVKSETAKAWRRRGKKARDQGTERVRLLPLHLAMEGFLAYHFRGPDVIWNAYSRDAMRFGLDPRFERVSRGTWLNGFEEALRTFEIVPDQVGVLVFVAEALACAFVLPHPDDYRALHRSLIDDFFGDLIVRYALAFPTEPTAFARLELANAKTVDDLREEVARVRGQWREYSSLLSEGLFDHDADFERIRTMGPFVLDRFMPTWNPEVDCHIGERITRTEDGELEYLKTFRLSSAQTRRAYLLSKLAEADWNLEDTAALLKTTVPDLVIRVKNAGFGYLFAPDVLAAAAKGEVLYR